MTVGKIEAIAAIVGIIIVIFVVGVARVHDRIPPRSRLMRAVDAAMNIVFGVVVLGVIGLVGVFLITPFVTRGRGQVPDEKALAQLSQTQANLRQTVPTPDERGQQATENQRVVAALTAERARLQLLLAADQRAIAALFEVQEQRNAKQQARERWFGFGLGVVSSLVASLLWAAAARLLGRRRSEAGGVG